MRALDLGTSPPASFILPTRPPATIPASDKPPKHSLSHLTHLLVVTSLNAHTAICRVHPDHVLIASRAPTRLLEPARDALALDPSAVALIHMTDSTVQ